MRILRQSSIVKKGTPRPMSTNFQEHGSCQLRVHTADPRLAGRGALSRRAEAGQLRSPAESAITGKPEPDSGTHFLVWKNGSVVPAVTFTIWLPSLPSTSAQKAQAPAAGAPKCHHLQGHTHSFSLLVLCLWKVPNFHEGRGKPNFVTNKLSPKYQGQKINISCCVQKAGGRGRQD